MVMVQDGFDRIRNTGGLFVIFADMRNPQELVYARSGQYSGFKASGKIPFDNWSMLSILSNLTINADHGKEMKTIKTDCPLALLVADYLEDASFRCTFEPQWHIQEQWVVLAKNKYGEAVAGAIAPAEKSKAGWVFIFPQLRKKGEFLGALMKNILPNFAPALFPHIEGQKWVHRAEYELPSVVEKALKISVIQEEAAKKVEVLEKAIQADREANNFLYDLLRESGGSLVNAVKKALGILGFTSVIDVDDEMKRAGKDAALREDLRIHDISPVLVVDVKGVAGHPADAEALQAQKHAFIYIHETGRADVRGLTIINHQRLLPPLDRDNEMPFRKEILDNAAQLSLGLITAWDLFRLARGILRNGWSPDHVKPLLYLTGRIHPIPTHYEVVGAVKQVWKSAFSITVEAAELHVGDRIAIEFPVDFEEQAISSLRLNDADVEAAGRGVEVGISRMESLAKVRPGFPVYRIKSQ